MADAWHDVTTADLGPLVDALAALQGTELEEQVFIAARSDPADQPEPVLDVAHMEEEPGDGRFQVYVTLPEGTTLDDYELPWPTGTGVVDDSGGNATLELGPVTPQVAANGLVEVAALLTETEQTLVWSTTLE